MIKLKDYVSTETVKARKQGKDISKMLKENIDSLEFYPSKLKVKHRQFKTNIK